MLFKPWNWWKLHH